MKNRSYFFILVFCSLSIFAQEGVEIKKNSYQINTRYKSGSYLIYDCAGSYYACVDEESNMNCQMKRQASKDKGVTPYACAPLKDFGSYDKCVEQNYNEINAQTTIRFCYPKNVDY